LEVFEDVTRAILSRNDSPDLPFRWNVNPYRGCLHACAYCYARPTHEYWGFGAGTDFDSKIIVKPDAAALLRTAFMKSSWNGELIVFSGNTDCDQPVEASCGLTRACLDVCAEFRNPVGIITKGILAVRDLDVLMRLRADAWAGPPSAFRFRMIRRRGSSNRKRRPSPGGWRPCASSRKAGSRRPCPWCRSSRG
jgi:DNA repair photolyase